MGGKRRAGGGQKVLAASSGTFNIRAVIEGLAWSLAYSQPLVLKQQ